MSDLSDLNTKDTKEHKEIIMPGLDECITTNKRKKMRILFLDDNPDRIIAAKESYGDDVKIVTTVRDCLRELSFHDWDIVSLDHDLGGKEFVDPDSEFCGMEVIRYLEKTSWPKRRQFPDFVIHSSNFFAAELMKTRLVEMFFFNDDLNSRLMENNPLMTIRIKPFGWKEYQRGVIAGAFDVMHVGYVRMFALAKERCHHLTILLHDKPGRAFKIETRKEILLAMSGIDDVLVYKTEDELTSHLNSRDYDSRFVGGDHKDKTSRGGLKLKTVYLDRQHKWSDTHYKEMIFGEGIHDE